MLLEASIQQELIHIASAFPEVRKLILFGSRARGDADQRSDMDIAIETDGMGTRQWLELADRLENMDTLLRIDIVRLEEASEPLRENIFREGQVLYERH